MRFARYGKISFSTGRETSLEELERRICENFKSPPFRRRPCRTFKGDIERNFARFIDFAVGSKKCFYLLYTAFLSGAGSPTQWEKFLGKRRNGIFREVFKHFLRRRRLRRELVASDERRFRIAEKLIRTPDPELFYELIHFLTGIFTVRKSPGIKVAVCRKAASFGEKLWGEAFVKTLHGRLLEAKPSTPGAIEGIAAGLSEKGLSIISRPWPAVPSPVLLKPAEVVRLREEGYFLDTLIL